MNKVTKNIAALIAFGIGTTTISFAQVTQQKIGINPTLINPNAALEIESATKGLLMPRLALTATNNFAPLAAHVAGMTVYNTAIAGVAPNNVTPGYYYNDGTQWVRVATGADAKTEPWRQQATTNEATANGQNIYQTGSVAVGDFSTAASTKKMEVKGNFKAEVSTGGNAYGMEIDHPLIPGVQTSANYWLGSAGNYRVNLVHSAAGVLSAGLIGTGGHESIIAVDDNRVTLGSRLNSLISKSEMRTEKTGNFFLEAYNNSNALDFAATVSLQDDGLRMVHSTTDGDGPNWMANSNRSEIFVQKGNGVRFAIRNSAGTQTGEYWFPKTTGLAGQVLTQSGTGGQIEWRSASSLVSNALSSSVNTMTSTVAGTASTAPIINTNVLGLSGTNLTSTVNGISSTALNLGPAITAGTTHTISNTVNTITSVVNGVSVTAPAVNTVSNTVAGGNVSTTVNGVAGTAVAISNALSSSANTLTSTVAGGTARTAPIINTNALGLSGTNLTSTVNGIASTAVDLGSAITAGTTHTLSNPTNTITSVVNGISVTAPAVNTNTLGLSGTNLTSTVNGISSTALNLGPAITAGTTHTISNPVNTITSVVNGVSVTAPAVNTVSNTVAGGNVSTTVNGVAGTAVAISNALSSSANTLTSTVAGGTARTAPIINTNVLGLSGTNLTSTVNGIASAALNLGPAITAGTTHTISNPANTITSVVNGVSVTAPAVNTNTLTATNGNLVSTVNGVASTPAVPVLISASNGLNATNGDVKLGGTLNTPTNITLNNNQLSFIGSEQTTNIRATGAFVQEGVIDQSSVLVRSADTNNNTVRTNLFMITNDSGSAQLVATEGATSLNIGASNTAVPAPIIFSTSETANTVHVERMRLTPSGQLAIGTTTIPTITAGSATINPKLHVLGDISTTGKVWTTNSVYADYVFEKYFKGSSDINPNYEFKSLNYVKDFIKANHHLPGVESIADLAKADNGYTFDITKLTVQSLEKIEELYLHTIEQQGKIDAQQAEIDQLKKEAENTQQRLERLEKLFLKD